MEDDMPKFTQMWLPGFEPKSEQPDLPGFADDEIEPSVSDMEAAQAVVR